MRSGKVVVSVLALAFGVGTQAARATIVYGSGADNNLYRIDPLTGTETLVGGMGHTFFDIGINPLGGQMYGLSGGYLYSVNKFTGASTVVGSLGVGTVNINSLVFSSSGVAYGASDNGSLYTINTT